MSQGARRRESSLSLSDRLFVSVAPVYRSPSLPFYFASCHTTPEKITQVPLPQAMILALIKSPASPTRREERAREGKLVSKSAGDEPRRESATSRSHLRAMAHCATVVSRRNPGLPREQDYSPLSPLPPFAATGGNAAKNRLFRPHIPPISLASHTCGQPTALLLRTAQ